MESNDKLLTRLGGCGESSLYWATTKDNGVLDPANSHYFLRLRGTPYQKGYAQGYLLAEDIIAYAVESEFVLDLAAKDRCIELVTRMSARLRDELVGLRDGIVARRGSLNPVSWETLACFSGAMPPSVVSSGISVWGSHTSLSKEEGDFVYAGGPGIGNRVPGIGKMAGRGVVVSDRAASPDEVDTAYVSFTGWLGLYSSGLNRTGVTIGGSAAGKAAGAPGFAPLANMFPAPTPIPEGFEPVLPMARRFLTMATRDRVADARFFFDLLRTHRPIGLHIQAMRPASAGSVTGVVIEGTWPTANYPEDVARGPAWDVSDPTTERLVDWRVDPTTRRGFMLTNRGELIGLDLATSSLHDPDTWAFACTLTVSHTDLDGEPLAGRASCGNETVSFRRRPLGIFVEDNAAERDPMGTQASYRRWGIIAATPSGASGVWVGPTGQTWGRWRRLASGRIEVSNATNVVLGEGPVASESAVLLKGSAIGLYFYILKDYVDHEFLGNYNISHLPNAQSHIVPFHSSYFGHRKLWHFQEVVEGKRDIDAGRLFDLYQQAWRNDGWDGDEAVLASWSSRNLEAFIAFGSDEFKATNIRRRPVHYTREDLFDW